MRPWAALGQRGAAAGAGRALTQPLLPGTRARHQQHGTDAETEAQAADSPTKVRARAAVGTGLSLATGPRLWALSRHLPPLNVHTEPPTIQSMQVRVQQGGVGLRFPLTCSRGRSRCWCRDTGSPALDRQPGPQSPTTQSSSTAPGGRWKSGLGPSDVFTR